MEKILILNGSPRAPKSNSKLYAGLFSDYCPRPTDYAAITRNNHLELCAQMEKYTDVLLVFPLYADALPVGLLNFLKSLEKHPPRKKPVISVLINCGFLEAHQNDIAIRMLRLFCRNNGYETLHPQAGQSRCLRQTSGFFGNHAAHAQAVPLGIHGLLDQLRQDVRYHKTGNATHGHRIARQPIISHDFPVRSESKTSNNAIFSRKTLPLWRQHNATKKSDN